MYDDRRLDVCMFWKFKLCVFLMFCTLFLFYFLFKHILHVFYADFFSIFLLESASWCVCICLWLLGAGRTG